MVAPRVVRRQISSVPRCLSALVLGVLGFAFTADSIGAPATAFKAPVIPASDGEILQEVPSEADPAVARMWALRAKFEAAPRSLQGAIELARSYVDYSRQIGDAHYAGYAEAVVAPWIALPQPPATALVVQATIFQFRHQFGDARLLLERTFAADPRNAQAWLTLATLDMVQGNYQSAARDCAQVTNTAGLNFGLACTGNLRSYVGQAHQGLALLMRADASGASVPAAYQAWIQGLIAETAERLGDWPLAEARYRKALTLMPSDNFLLVAFADFLLDRGRSAEVIALLADHVQSDTAFLRIALAKAALHAADAPRYAWIMGARFEALRLRGSDYFGREQARFALELEHDPERALDLARRNWQLQRAPWDARVLLDAAQAARQPRAAQQVLEFLAQSRLEDPIIEPLAQELRSQARIPPGAGQ
jgi:tetratricopeptide (TPR) repeat protein